MDAYDRLDNHADMHGHVDTAAGMATGSLQTFAQVGIEVDPLLQFAVGRLRIEAGEIELGQLGAAVCADGECFHRFRVGLYGRKDTENQWKRRKHSI